MRLRCDVIAIALLLACPADARHASAQAIGLYHMPSTVAQYLGYGYGAGRHAPIVCTAAQRPARSPRIAKAPPCYGPLGPACYEPIGCYGAPCSPVGPLLQPPIEMMPMTATPIAPPTPRVAPATAVAPLSGPRHSPPVAMRPTPFGWR
jgi:hypothetical protein